MIANLDKKHKYLILSLIVTALMFWYVDGLDPFAFDFARAALIVAVAVVGALLVQLPNINLAHFLLSSIMPFHLVAGGLLSLWFFPNLAVPLRLVFVLLVGAGYYIVNLVNNIFLVVEDRKELIPLYRAAVTWGQIIMMVVAIPFFAGVFKLPLSPISQNLIAALTSLLFSYYLVWMVGLDREVRKATKGERSFLIIFVAFVVFAGGISVSFVPTESFLRALFVTTVLMLGLNYLYGHLKNSISRKNIFEYFTITIVFFLILTIFRP